MKFRILGAAIGGMMLGACGVATLPLDAKPESSPRVPVLTQASEALIVFNTAAGVKTMALGDLNSDEFKLRVEDFYPAACVDGDGDRDGVPDSMDMDNHSDDDNDDDESDDRSDDSSDADGGTQESREPVNRLTCDDQDREQHLNAHRCKRCNRGPGTNGDFRLEINGDEARLGRGRVASVVGDKVTVPSPDGEISIQMSADTEVDGDRSTLTTGAEIEVRGSVGEGERTIAAERLKILCPGMPTMPAGEVPPGADGLPTVELQ